MEYGESVLLYYYFLPSKRSYGGRQLPDRGVCSGSLCRFQRHESVSIERLWRDIELLRTEGRRGQSRNMHLAQLFSLQLALCAGQLHDDTYTFSNVLVHPRQVSSMWFGNKKASWDAQQSPLDASYVPDGPAYQNAYEAVLTKGKRIAAPNKLNRAKKKRKSFTTR